MTQQRHRRGFPPVEFKARTDAALDEMAEVAVPRQLFHEILRLIGDYGNSRQQWLRETSMACVREWPKAGVRPNAR